MTWLSKSSRLTIALVLLSGGGWIIYDTAWLMAEGPNKPITSILPNSNATPDSMKSDVAEADWSALFGEPGATDKNHVAVIGSENLGVSLLGVIDHVEQGGETIIVKLEDGDQLVFRNGDYLVKDFKVISINKQQVVLSNNVRRLLLPLEALQSVDGVARSSEDSQAEPDQESPQRSTHEKIQAFAGLVPVKEGVAAGYRLGEDSKNTQESLGLREGDVILSMNGYPLGTEADDKLASHARGDGPITLTVRRNDEKTVITVKK